MTMDVGGHYRLTDPVLADGCKAPLKLDVSGNLCTTSPGGATAAGQTTTNTEIGIVTEAAPASDTASSGLNGRLQRIAQRLTSLIALLPAALGSAAAAASLAVTASTEDIARQGIITETAPASDTASSGQNGRLQRIAQRLTSIIALLPAALGGAGGLKVEQQASEVHLGEVGTPAILVDVTPVCDTSIYAAGDTVFDKTVVTGALRVNDGFGILESLQVIDKDDQGAALDLYFFSSNITTFGTANAAPSISDADAATVLAIVSIATGDWKDLGGVRVASVKAINAILKAATGAKTIYVAATTGGTPTYTASGLVLRVGILQG